MVRELVMPHLRTVYDDLLRLAESADFMVSHPLAVALPLVAERTGPAEALIARAAKADMGRAGDVS